MPLRLYISLITILTVSCSNDEKQSKPEQNHSPETVQSHSKDQLEYNDSLKNFIGTWESNGEETLIISKKDDKLIIAPALSSVWTFEFSDMTYEGDSITFTEKYFLSNGKAHALNGIPCKTRIVLSSEDSNILQAKMLSEEIGAYTEQLKRKTANKAQ